MSTRFLSVAMASLFLVACGSNEASPAGSGDATVGPTGSGPGSSTSTGSGTGGSDPGTTTLTAGIGPINIASGVEHTQCVIVNLKNPAGVFVRKFKTTLHEGSHHMIVYRSTATAEKTTPYDCQSFQGILNGTHPIFIAQQTASELDFPTADDGTPVGLELEANQMLQLELHYINTTGAPLDVQGNVEIETVPLDTMIVKSDLAFWGTQDINIPPNGSYDTGVKFQPALAGTKSFALTTHQHQLGTEMQVWYGTGASDTSDRVADGTNWKDPPLVLLTPPLDFPTNGAKKSSTKGFAFECHWQNTTPNQVGFGESFNDEMCFLWHYYYPSVGFQVCFDGLCKTQQ